MQLDHHLKELWGIAEVLEDQPEAFLADDVKGLGEIYKCCVQSFVLFVALFLQLQNRCASVCSEAALAFRKIFFRNGWYEPVE